MPKREQLVALTVRPLAFLVAGQPGGVLHLQIASHVGDFAVLRATRSPNGETRQIVILALLYSWHSSRLRHHFCCCTDSDRGLLFHHRQREDRSSPDLFSHSPRHTSLRDTLRTRAHCVSSLNTQPERRCRDPRRRTYWKSQRESRRHPDCRSERRAATPFHSED